MNVRTICRKIRRVLSFLFSVFLTTRSSPVWRYLVGTAILVMVLTFVLVVFSDSSSSCLRELKSGETFDECVAKLLGLSRQTAENLDEQESKNAVLKFLAFGIGGLVLMLQALIAGDRAASIQRTAESQAKATEQQAKANRLAEQGLRQERLKCAIEHLGNESESVRLGGAYELFHLAQDTETMRRTVLDILCAHIRRTTGEDEYRKKCRSKPSEEIQNLLTLLFVDEHDAFIGLRINLCESWLNGADLKAARLRGANLREAHLNEANFDDACLNKARLEKAHLKEASFLRASLREAELGLAHMQGAEFLEAGMQGANIQYGRLATASFTYAHLQGAYLAGAMMHGAYLIGTRMEGANLSGTYLQATRLMAADLRGAGAHQWDSSTPFADRIRVSVGNESDLSGAGSEGMYSVEYVQQMADEILSTEKQAHLKRQFRQYLDNPDPPLVPENHGAILGFYKEREATQWISEHEAAMQGLPARKHPIIL